MGLGKNNPSRKTGLGNVSGQYSSSWGAELGGNVWLAELLCVVEVGLLCLFFSQQLWKYWGRCFLGYHVMGGKLETNEASALDSQVADEDLKKKKKGKGVEVASHRLTIFFSVKLATLRDLGFSVVPFSRFTSLMGGLAGWRRWWRRGQLFFSQNLEVSPCVLLVPKQTNSYILSSLL